MNNPPAFFAALRKGLLGPVLTPSEVGGVNALLTAAKGWPVSWTAYLLATAYHETGATMLPVKERGGDAYFFRMYDPAGARPKVAAELGNTQPGDGARFPGRGYVQATGRANYARASRKLGADFVANPVLMLDPQHAADVARLGMAEGWFTSRTLAGCLPAVGNATRRQFYNARPIINRLDRADDIAGYALEFQADLNAGGYA